MALGTGTAAANSTNTALTSEISGSRTSLTSTSVVDSTVIYEARFPAGTGTGAITEAALFNAISGGTMFARSVFSVYNKGASDTITFTWTIALG